mmetsp:Transcript_56100/g.142831  ORF Transcript_56100/g.142831 Transcript_56100/m.142831 type:complete len:1410 (+) Transcript_56100:124-4353(+)
MAVHTFPGSSLGPEDGKATPTAGAQRGSRGANCFSRLFFLWVNQLVTLSSKKVIEDGDIYDIDPSSEVQHLTAHFDQHWHPEGLDSKELGDYTYLKQAWMHLFGRRYAVAGLLMFLQNATSCLVPFLLKAFVEWFVDKSRPGWEGWLLGGLMLCAQVLGNQVFACHGIMKLYVIGMDSRSLVNSLVYRKAMRLSHKARSQTTTGQVMSLMSADSERLPMAMLGLNSLWIGPVTVTFGLTALVALIGWAGIVVVPLMIATIQLPIKIGMFQGRIMQKQMIKTDARVKTVSEGLQGIRVLKYYAWDGAFAERVRGCRNQEIRQLRRSSWAGAFAHSLMNVIPLVLELAMISAFSLLYPETFTPANSFTALALLNLIRMPLSMIPMGIKGLVDLRSTFTRLQRYLLLEEHDLSRHETGGKMSTSTPAQKRGRVEISCGAFEWEVGEPIELGAPGKGKGKGKGKDQGKGKGTGKDQDASEGAAEKPKAREQSFALKDVSVSAAAGQLCAVLGKVGSGKSSLLNAILLEMPKRSGEVIVEGSVAYCAQVPWIQNATLRDNILFGGTMDEARYDEVIDMCALGPDCEALPGGDLTEIGEKGVTLSGGQKARVALARACYRQADVYLLDDILSAVDSETGGWLFERCIKTLLARKALVILATNAVNLLEQVSVVWVMQAGQITEQGTFNDLRARQGSALNELLSLVATEKSQGDVGKMAAGAKDASVADSGPCAMAKRTSNWSVSRSQTRLSGDSKSGQLTAKELRAEGEVSWKVWYFYFITCPGNLFFPVVCLLSATLGQATKNVFQWWVSYWSSTSSEMAEGDEDMDHGILIYAALGLIACAFNLSRALVLAELLLCNGKRLHELLLDGVLRAPMAFFDTTSMGRIMNRFSKDMDSMDTRLQQCLPMFVSLSTDVIGMCLTIGFNMPFFFVPLLPMLVFYWHISRRFRPLARDLQRLESTSRSPIFAQFSETIVGTSTIRAYGEGQRFLNQSVERINISNRAFFTMHNANRWLQLRLEFVGTLLLLVVVGFALEGRASGAVEAGVVALSMFYAINAAQVLNFAIRMLSETEARMTSAERIHEYAVEVAPEAPAIIDERPPATWPSQGHIELCNVSMRYRPQLPLVLKNVSVVIEGGSKVGICGRTGSGKSTLFSVLFRLVDIYSPANACDGCIKIDGVDIGGLGLSDLRRGLAIIPQDAVMFAGSVRENLDLFGERTDAQLWEALRHASLEDAVKRLTGGLDAMVQEGGDNFSCGERQLVCLARALLRQSKIICLDEATANIDVKTDATIQEVIKTEFADRTVLTIAHRLHTIAAHDRILVLDAGQVAEFGGPAELLALGQSGKFRALVQELGQDAAAALEREVLGQAVDMALSARTRSRGAQRAPSSAPVVSHLLSRSLSRSLCLQGICVGLE